MAERIERTERTDMAESREDREDGYGRADMGGIDEEDME